MDWHETRSALIAFAFVAACGGEGTGDARILVSTEDTIVSGLEPGAGEEEIADGWAIAFDTYVVTIGNVALGRSSDAEASAVSDAVRILDLRAVGTGVELARFDGIASGRWDRFSYETPAATADTPCDATVDPLDCEMIRSLGLTYLIRGTMTKEGGQSCPPGGACRPVESIAFELSVAAPSVFSNCESEGIGGIAVPERGESVDALWIHGDHVFFNVFGGVEGSVVRRAQWLANADLDGDDFVDMDELAMIGFGDFAELFPDFATGYSFSGAPIAIATAADLVVAQLTTQGHLNGEGECIPSAL